MASTPSASTETLSRSACVPMLAALRMATRSAWMFVPACWIKSPLAPFQTASKRLVVTFPRTCRSPPSLFMTRKLESLGSVIT